MKAKTRFMKMYYKLPEQARKNLVINAVTRPMSLNVCAIEIRCGTELGNDLLKQLGYENEERVK